LKIYIEDIGVIKVDRWAIICIEKYGIEVTTKNDDNNNNLGMRLISCSIMRNNKVFSDGCRLVS
jgi:hypothetical protein